MAAAPAGAGSNPLAVLLAPVGAAPPPAPEDWPAVEQVPATVADGGGCSPAVASEKPEQDRGLLLELTRTFAKAPKYTPDSIRTDRELVIRIVREHREGWRLVRHIIPELRADREVLLATVKGSAMGWRALLFAAPELREDRDLGLEAIRKNAAALELLAPSLRQDSELVSESLLAIQKRMDMKAGKAAQDWDRSYMSGGHTSARGRLARKRASGIEPSAGNEEWSERLRKETEHGMGSQGGLAGGSGGGCGGGESFRVVPLACVRIKQQSGLIFSRLGRVDVNLYGELVARARCELPFTRVLDGEQPRDSLNRYLQTVLAPMAKRLELDSDFQVACDGDDASATSGRYLRSVFKASMEPKCKWKRTARSLGMVQVRSMHSAGGSPHTASLGRRFCGGTAGMYVSPRPPDMYALLDKETENGRSLPPMNKRLVLYAWIPQWEFDWLRGTETGRAALREWLSDVNLGPPLLGAQTSGLSTEPLSARSVEDGRDAADSSSIDSDEEANTVASCDGWPVLSTPHSPAAATTGSRPRIAMQESLPPLLVGR